MIGTFGSTPLRGFGICTFGIFWFLWSHITCQPPSHGPTSPNQTARPLFVPKCFPQTSLVQTTLASPGLKSYAGKIPKLLVRSWCWPLPLNISFLLPPLLAQSVRQSHRIQLRASTCSHGAEVSHSCLQDKPLTYLLLPNFSKRSKKPALALLPMFCNELAAANHGSSWQRQMSRDKPA